MVIPRYADPLEVVVGRDDPVPLVAGDLGRQKLAAVARQVFLAGLQQLGVEIKLHELARELLQQVIRNDVHRPFDQPAQLAIYLGYVHYRMPGATVVGLAFVLPSFLMVLALGWAYKLNEGLAWMQAVFYGVGTCVIGIIGHSALKLTAKTIGRDRLLWAIFGASAAVTVCAEAEIVSLFLGAGALVWLIRAAPFSPRPSGTAAIAGPFAAVLPGVPTADRNTHLKIAMFFAKAGAFAFGSGLAIVPFLYSGVGKEYGRLDDQQFLDAVAVAMITPGPVVITLGFIGFLVGGFSGATVAAIATFLPCYLFTIVPAPYFKKHAKRPGIVAFVDGVTAAAIGAIAGAVVVAAAVLGLACLPLCRLDLANRTLRGFAGW